MGGPYCPASPSPHLAPTLPSGVDNMAATLFRPQTLDRWWEEEKDIFLSVVCISLSYSKSNIVVSISFIQKFALPHPENIMHLTNKLMGLQLIIIFIIN